MYLTLLHCYTTNWENDNRTLFQGFGAKKFKVKVLEERVFTEGHFLSPRWCLVAVSLQGERNQGEEGPTLCTPELFDKACSCDLPAPKGLLLDPVALGNEVLTHIWTPLG